jgi:hypothetical protein
MPAAGTPRNRVGNQLPASLTTGTFLFLSSRVRNTGLQIKIKIYFDNFLFMLEVVPQY